VAGHAAHCTLRRPISWVTRLAVLMTPTVGRVGSGPRHSDRSRRR